MKIRLLMVGKTRRPEMNQALADYVKRIGRACPIEVAEVRDGEAAIKRLGADRRATAVLLDAGGKTFDSGAFAKWLGEHETSEHARLFLFVGMPTDSRTS